MVKPIGAFRGNKHPHNCDNIFLSANFRKYILDEEKNGYVGRDQLLYAL